MQILMLPLLILHKPEGLILRATPEARIADYWNDGINASFDITDEFIPDTKMQENIVRSVSEQLWLLKQMVLQEVHQPLSAPADGKANNVILKNKTSANYSISRSRSSDIYPASQFGIIALLRQVNYDAQWYKQLPAGYFHDDGLEAYNANLSLPQIFEVTNKLEVMRADKIGKEFGINYIIKGGGDEYQALNDIKKERKQTDYPS